MSTKGATEISTLNTLPPELHIELIHHLSSTRDTLVSFSSCNRYWRWLCLPLVFSRVTIGDRSNKALEQFITWVASPHGSLIRDLSLCYPSAESHSEEDLNDQDETCCPGCAEQVYMEWTDQRDKLTQELFARINKLSSLRITVETGYRFDYTRETFTKSFPPLTSSTSGIQSMSLEGFEAAHLLQFISLPGTLESFTICCMEGAAPRLSNNVWSQIWSANLTKLKIVGYDWSIQDAIEIFKESSNSSINLDSLQELWLGWRETTVELSAVANLLSTFGPSLRTVFLAFKVGAELIHTHPVFNPKPLRRTPYDLILEIDRLDRTEVDALFKVFRYCDIPRLRLEGHRCSRTIFENIATRQSFPFLRKIEIPRGLVDDDVDEIVPDGWPSVECDWSREDSNYAEEMCAKSGIEIKLI